MLDSMESIFVATGAVVVIYYAVKLLLFSRMLFPKFWFPVPKSFFTSMGEWAGNTLRVCVCVIKKQIYALWLNMQSARMHKHKTYTFSQKSGL